MYDLLVNSSGWYACPSGDGQFDNERILTLASMPPTTTGLKSFVLSMIDGRLFLRFDGKTIADYVPIPEYTDGHLFIGTYHGRYGPMDLSIRKLTIRPLK